MDSDNPKRQEDLEHKLNAILSSGAGQISNSQINFLKLPETLNPLVPLASNLYWVWNRRIRRIFEEIDIAAWDGLGHNPVLLLQRISDLRYKELSSNQEFVTRLSRAYDIQREYLHKKEDTWFRRTFGMLERNELVAYFSAEFGLTECLRTYSGGLGILSGDHLKSASDLGIPLVGIGIFYRRGYFSQSLTPDGWQLESYPENNPSELPMEPALDPNSKEPLVVSVPIEDRQIRVKAWRVAVGRVTLLLLDTNLPGLNSREDCEITAELYGGDIHTRIKQEIILGFGGARIIRALGLQPTVYHLNEGHASFAILERLREIIEEDKPGTSFKESIEFSKSCNLFTTHTPVAAGIDVFDKSLIERYLGWYAKKLGISLDDLLDLGREKAGSSGFNMAVFAIRLSSNANAVSKLHRRVASKLWQSVVKERDPGRELGSVTNGVHSLSWISDSFADLYDQFLGPEWDEDTSNAKVWARIAEIPDELVWQTHMKQKAKLVEFIRTNFSLSGYEVGPSGQFLDPNALTIGFARRFATYKRASLILSEKEKLLALLESKDRPVQFIFSGKAHPRDHEGKKVIQEIVNFTKSADSKGRVVFLPNYDISMARHLVQGVDVWLNNPQRPLEASGTSGMKAVPNGVLNFSVLDGWWDEAHSPEYGWAINPLDFHEDPIKQAKADAEALFATLESEIIPEYYSRNPQGIPISWVQKMKGSISLLTPRFTTRRMVKEYAEEFYFKSAKRVADSLNKSEMGSDVLEGASNKWDK
jgi:glycogen phosphorylase